MSQPSLSILNFNALKEVRALKMNEVVMRLCNSSLMASNNLLKLRRLFSCEFTKLMITDFTLIKFH
jgi:hypothetical protein